MQIKVNKINFENIIKLGSDRRSKSTLYHVNNVDNNSELSDEA